MGAIIEFAQHGTAVAPLVARTIAHYLGIEDTRFQNIRVAVPTDSAPQPFQLPPFLDSMVPTLPPIPRDTVLPRDSVLPRPPTR